MRGGEKEEAMSAIRRREFLRTPGGLGALPQIVGMALVVLVAGIARGEAAEPPNKVPAPEPPKRQP